jgi:phosphoribosylformylglycinamidine synthase
MCHPSLTQHILKHYNEDWDLPSIAERARASVVGKVNDSGIYRLTHNGTTVCNARSQDITSGLLYTRPTKLSETALPEPGIACDARGNITTDDKNHTTIAEVFAKMLAHPNHGSKARVYRHYDKTVIGNTIVEAGEADASVVMPLRDLPSYLPAGAHPGWTLPSGDERVGAVFAGDGNPRYGKISAYWQGALAAVEAMMNVAATGATPRALTDCLNYGNPELPEHLAALEEGVRGISDAARGIAFDDVCVPVISGNVSLYNSLPDGSAIPPSAIVCAVGVLPDAATAVTMQIKKSGSTLCLIGERKDECGGSAYYEVLGHLGSKLPQPDFATAAGQMRCIIDAIAGSCVLAGHDISDGGLLLALFEMLCPQRNIGGSLGADIDLSSLGSALSPDRLLFSQTPGFVVEVKAECKEQLGPLAKAIGTVNETGVLTVRLGKEKVFERDVKSLMHIWDSALPQALDGIA